MTTPAPGVALPYTLHPGAPAQRITNGNNSPAGLALVNRGDAGGTIWIMGGPVAQAAAVPLGPGASMTWTDQINVPYAYVTGSGPATETLIVTSQAQDYTNPTVVAAATATQLAAGGIPSTFLDGNVGDWKLDSGLSSGPISVGQYASLVISANWPQPPAASAAFTLTFSDPAAPSLPSIILWGSNDNAAEQGQYTWQVPVLAPQLVITNVANAAGDIPGYFAVVGNNRTVPRFRQIGDEAGIRHLGGTVGALTGVKYPLVPTNYNNGAPYLSDSIMTRFNGPIAITTNTGASSGYLFPTYADNHGNQVQIPIRVPTTGGVTQLSWTHPSVPVHWYYRVDTAGAAGFALDIVAAY